MKNHSINKSLLEWKIKVQNDLENNLYLNNTETYNHLNSNIDILHSKLHNLKSHIVCLEMHANKLKQHIAISKVVNHPNRIKSPLVGRVSTVKSSTPNAKSKGSGHASHQLSDGVANDSSSLSDNIQFKFGSRIRDLAYASGVDNDELAVQLTQLFQCMTPHLNNAHQVAYYVNCYKERKGKDS
jgi:hypothetical protein